MSLSKKRRKFCSRNWANTLGLLLCLVAVTGCDSSGFTGLSSDGAGSSSSGDGGPFAFSDSGSILPNAFTGQVYTVDFATSNGVNPVTYSVSAGSLPAGLSLQQTGVLSGKITASPGIFNFTIQAEDAGSNSITQALTLTVSVPFALESRALPDAIVGSVYTNVLTAQGGQPPYSYAATGLPTGLSLSSSTGLILGNPTATGNYTVVVTATDQTGAFDTENVLLNVITPISATPTIATSSLPNGAVNSSYTAAIIVGGGVVPYHFTITSGALPAGLSLDPSQGLITGTPTSSGVSSFAVKLTDGVNNTVTANYTLTITTPPSPQIATTSLTPAVVGTPYAQVITATSGINPYTFAIQTGALPAGLTLDSGTGIISGTPTATGTANFTAKVTDSYSDTGTKSLSIIVTAPPAPVITTSSVSNGTAGTAYVQSIGVTLGVLPYAFTISAGALPNGLAIDAGTGIISGTPATAGSSSFTVKVTDNIGASATKAYSMTVSSPASPTITTASLPSGTTGTSYSQTLATSGGTAPYTFAITSGSLQAGLTFSSATGTISGTPTASGTASLTIQVTDSASQSSSKSLSLQVVAAAVPQLTNTTLPNGLVGTVYSSVLSVLNGVTPYTFSISAGTLQAGLSLDPNTGILSGTPTASGNNSITFEVTDSLGGTSTKTLSLDVIQPAPPIIGTASVPNAVIGSAYAQVISVTGGVLPYTFTISSGSLPAGMSFSASTGILSGTPSATGTSSFTVKVTDNIGVTATQSLALTVSSTAPPTVTTSALSGGSVGSSYAQVISASGGATPYTYSISVGSLPTGLSISSTTGLITGTPTTAGTFSFTAKVTDANSNSGTAALSITISSAASPIITTSSVANGTAGVAYVQAIAVSQGILPYTFSISSGSLPAGLSISSNTGVISGTPSASGAASFTVKVTDAVSDFGTEAYSMNVAAPASPTITTSSLGSGTVGQTYSQIVLASGGTPAYAFSITSGSLQSGLSFNGTTGVISGTPTGSGTVSLTFQVSDANSQTATKTLSLTIVPATAPQITNTSLPNGLIGTAYSTVLAGVNGTTPYTFALTSGTLPAGLSLNVNSGVISGTPTTAGTAALTFSITDSVSNSSSKSLSLQVVAPTPPSFTTTTLSSATTESPYAAPLIVTAGVIPYTFSLASGSLPTGITMSSSSGILSGTPTAAGVSNFTVQVTDSIGVTATQALTLTVANPAAPVFSTTSLASGTAGSAYMQTVQATGGYGALTYSITSGTPQTGLSFSNGTLSGIPSTTGSVSLTFKVTDSLNSSSTTVLSLQVVSPAAPTITTNSLPNGTETISYAQVVGVSGGVSPYTFALSSGSLPAGLSLNTSTGVISGTPTATGSNSFTVKVTDSLSSVATKALSISISSPAAPTISNTTLSGGQITVPYSQVVLVSGGVQPYTFSISAGALPAGVSLNSSTGTVTGTPTSSGAFNFTVLVTDSVSNTVSQTYNVSINPSPYATLAFTTSTILAVALNNNETRDVDVTGGLPPYTWSITSGAVPGGMAFSTTTGQITGAATATGTSTFTVQVVDQRSTTISQSFSLVVAPILTVSTSSLPSEIAGSAYSTSVAASGGTAPYTFGSSGLPTGITMLSSGAVSGTASVVGSYTVVVTVTDANGLTAQKSISMIVAGALSISTSTLPVSNVVQPYSAAVVTSGGQAPLTFTLTSGQWPTGLSLNPSTGVISGTPAAGTNARTHNFAVTVQVADSAGQTASKSYTLQVTIGPRVWDDISNKLRPAAIGVHYLDVPRETGGVGVLTWAATGLPSGLTMNSTSGYISGTPAAGSAGTYSVAVNVTDANGSVSPARSKSLTVVSAGGTAGFDTAITTPITTITGNIISFKMGNLTNHANGILDYVAVTSNSGVNDIIVGINNGDGTFTNYPYQTMPITTWTPVDVVIADINGDGMQDILILESGAASTAQIEIIKGDNNWTTGGTGMTRQVISLTGISATFFTNEQLAVGDINGDGFKDIVFSSNNAGKAVVIMNCGSLAASVNITYGGVSTACNGLSQSIFDYYTGPAGGISYTAVGAYGVALVPTHTAHPTYLDLLVTTNGNKTILDFPNTTDNGVFGASVSYGTAFVSGASAQMIRSGFDLDADGNQDVVVEGSDGVYALYGNGTGSFAAYADVTSTNIPNYAGFSAAVGDINGDGCPDIVTISRASLYFSTQVYLANMVSSVCQRSFGAQRVMNSGYQLTGLGLGKVFSTSTLDLMEANTNYNQHVQVYKNSGSSTVPFASYVSTFANSGPFFYAAPPAYDNQVQGAPAVGDINNDGYPDFIVKTGGSASIYLGSAGGNYTAETTEVGTGDVAAQWWTQHAILLADVNGDGNLDFIAGNYNNNSFGSVSVTLGNGDGTFGSQQLFGTDQSGCTTGGGVYSVGVADFNRDGIPDLVVGHACNSVSRISVFFGYGDGTFNTSPTIITPASGQYTDDMVLMDINGDGIPDIVAATNLNVMQIFKGTGSGTFTSMTSVGTGFAGNGNIASLEVGDINNDGMLDFVMVQNAGATWTMLQGNTATGSGTTGAATSFAGPTTTNGLTWTSVKLVDWNADGILDVVGFKQSAGMLYYNGTGNASCGSASFTAPTQPWLTSNPGANMDAMPVIIDLNGDGYPDILNANENGNVDSSVGIMFNYSTGATQH